HQIENASSVRPLRPRLAVSHLASPRAVLDAAALDVLLELLHAFLDAAAKQAERVADVLRCALRLVGHEEANQRAVGPDRLEADGAGVRRIARDALPTDFLVRHLLGDLGIPLLVLAENLGVPAHVRVVELLDLFDAVHETWEFLKLRPLVVNGADGAVDFDRLFDALHVISPCYAPDKPKLLQVAFRRHALCISVLADTRTFDSNQCFPHKGHSAAAAAEWHTFFARCIRGT